MHVLILGSALAAPEQPENNTSLPELDVESEEEDGDVLGERENESKVRRHSRLCY